MRTGGARLWLVSGAILGLLSVAFGAFGAHALEGRFDDHAIDTWRLAADYQFRHAIALLVLGTAMRLGAPPIPCRVAGVGWLLGTACFSGSLYLLAAGEFGAIALVTPVGGLLLLIGWSAAAFAFLRWDT